MIEPATASDRSAFGPGDVEEAWSSLCDDLAPALPRDLARRLGVTAQEAGGFSDFAKAEALTDPVAFVDATWLRTPPALLRRAHLVAGFWGLAADRCADGQAADAEHALPLLDTAWRRALAQAVGDAHHAHRACAAAHAAFLEGCARERVWASEGSVSFDAYSAGVVLRTRWLSASTCAGAQVERRESVRTAFERVLVAMQLLDDTADAEEDERLRGVSVPTLLGLRPSACALLATQVHHEAADAVAMLGLPMLSTWIRARAALCAPILADDPSERLLDALSVASLRCPQRS